MKKLYLLRHAKSDQDCGLDDHARPLNKRGENSCIKIGNYLKNNNITFDKIISSDSTRTSQTIQNTLKSAHIQTEINFKKSLYLASSGQMLKEINSTEDSAQSLLVVAHNPGTGDLALKLFKDGVEDSYNEMRYKYPTAALCCYSFDIQSWSEIEPFVGSLEFYIKPKDL